MIVKESNNRIVFVITDFGSFNNFLSEIAIELSKKNKEVHVITSKEKVIKIDDKYNYSDNNIIFHFFKFPRSFNFLKHYQVSSEIQKKIKEINPAVVSLHFTTGIFTSVIRGKLPYKTIGTFHGLGYPVISNPIKKIIFKAVEFFSAARLDEIWVLNKSDKKLLAPHFNNVYLLPTNGLGCDLTKFDPNSSVLNRNALRIKYSIAQEEIIISFIGRYVNFKGYDTVVKMFMLLEKEFKNIKLITMGGYDSIHPTGLNEREILYVKNNPNIIDIGFTKDVEAYLSLSDLFVFPSKKEGVPVCIVEALAMGVPTVTFDARGCNDLIVNDYNGILMPLDADPSDFAQQVGELLKDKARQKLLRENILADRTEYSRNRFIEHQLKYFENL